MSNGGIGLSTDLGPLLFTSYMWTSVLSFLDTIIGFLYLIINKEFEDFEN